MGEQSFVHTLDDQAETVLLRLARGAGADGLSAMEDDRTWLGIRWLRPLLSVRRSALRTWLTAEDLSWAEDPTNDDTRYDRVRARAILAAIQPLGLDALALVATADRLRAQRTVLEAEAAALAARARTWGAFGEAWIDPAVAGKALPESARRLTRDTLMRVTGSPYGPRQRSLAALLPALWQPEFPGTTLAGCVIARIGPRLLICREPAAVAPPARPGPEGMLWDGRWWISGSFGDDCQIGALGAAGVGQVKRAIADGFAPPPAWDSAPHRVRLTLPAVWKPAPDGTAHLVAVPPIAYFSEKSRENSGFRAEVALRHDASERG